MVLMRHYELMIILDPSLDERTVTPSLEQFLTVVKNDKGTVEKVYDNLEFQCGAQSFLTAMPEASLSTMRKAIRSLFPP